MKKLVLMTMAALLAFTLGLPTYAADQGIYSSSGKMLLAAGEQPAMTSEEAAGGKAGKKHKAKKAGHKAKKGAKKGTRGTHKARKHKKPA